MCVWGFDTAWAAKCCNDGALVQVVTSAGCTTPFHCDMSRFKLINPTKTKKKTATDPQSTQGSTSRPAALQVHADLAPQQEPV